MKTFLLLAVVVHLVLNIHDVAAQSSSKQTKAKQQLSDASIYNLGSIWTNQDGQTVSLDTLKGKIHVVAMVFTSCKYACPRIAADMQALERRLPSEQKNNIDFLLFSFDTKRDTPKKLREFASQSGLDLKHWTLFRGSKLDVRRFAAVLGVNYKQDANGDFAHSNIITILNVKGEIAYQQIGLGADPTAALEAIAKVIKQ